ncbi:hypothetical protein Ocin01_04406 [Orchesella cincta]|uniref:Uncharacterized protein n=1 Tax=Orchesella cincta TaxID=48709 RepID=A0A1D2NB91_ORCCI|nr:hypothetical protein Ocin01_04406 [Orchesella cincta]
MSYAVDTKSKPRLSTHAHKLDNIDSRKRSPDGHTGPPSPSEVIVFNNTNQSNGNGRGGAHVTRTLPEVPQIEEIQQFLRDMWDRKMHEIKTQNLKVLWIKSDREMKRDGATVSSGSHLSGAPKQRNSPQHSNRK